MTIEKKTYEAISHERDRFFDDVLGFLNSSGAECGLWNSYKKEMVTLQKIPDSDLKVLDRLAPDKADEMRKYNILIEEAMKELNGGPMQEEEWSAHHIELKDISYKGLKMSLVSSLVDEDNPNSSDLRIVMTVEGINSSKNLADIIELFKFKEA